MEIGNEGMFLMLSAQKRPSPPNLLLTQGTSERTSVPYQVHVFGRNRYVFTYMQMQARAL